MPPKPPVGHFVPTDVLRAVHDYLMTRPCAETLELVVALRSTKPMAREPK